MAEQRPLSSIDKDSANREAVHLIRAFGDCTSISDVIQLSQDCRKRYAPSARKKILEGLREALAAEKTFSAHSYLQAFLCDQVVDMRHTDLDHVTRTVMNVALAAGEETACKVIYHFLTLTNPKQAQEYFLPEHCLANVPRDLKMGPVSAKVLLTAVRDKTATPDFLRRWLITLLPSVWTKGRPLLNEEDSGTILGTLATLRLDDFPPQLAVAVPALIALTDTTTASAFLSSQVGRAFRDLVPQIPDATTATSPPSSGGVQRTVISQQGKKRASDTLSSDKVQRGFGAANTELLSGAEGLDPQEAQVLKSLATIMSSLRCEQRSLAAQLAQAKHTLLRKETELADSERDRQRIAKEWNEAKGVWNEERNAFMAKDKEARVIHDKQQNQVNRLSLELEKANQELERAERIQEKELKDGHFQWTNDLLEVIRPLATDVRDHILGLRKENPKDKAIRSLCISYYNLHRELSQIMGLSPESECIPRKYLTEDTME